MKKATDTAESTFRSVTLRVDPAIMDRFKILCIKEQTTMKDYITQLIIDELKKKGE